MNNYCPFKYCLFTNNHVLNKSNIEIGNNINFEYYNGDKKIEIAKNRKVYTNEELDYTCIEIFESDGIINFFKLDPLIFKDDKKYLENSDIFILQYPNSNELSFSNGKIKSLKDNKIIHNASTDHGSSGSPLIRRSKDNYIIGLHFGGIKKNEKNYLCNFATPFDLIINDINGIKEPINEINCIYIFNNKNEIIYYMILIMI